METRVKINKNGMELLSASVDFLILQYMMQLGFQVEVPYTIHVQSPLGDEIRLVTEDEL